MPSTPRVILSIILIPAILLIAAALLMPLFIDKDKILELAAGTLQEKTGASLTVAGESSLSFFPMLGVTLGDASLAMPGETQPSLQVRSLDIGVRLLPLLSGRADIDSIALDGLTVKIASGQNLSTFLTSLQPLERHTDNPRGKALLRCLLHCEVEHCGGNSV